MDSASRSTSNDNDKMRATINMEAKMANCIFSQEGTYFEQNVEEILHCGKDLGGGSS